MAAAAAADIMAPPVVEAILRAADTPEEVIPAAGIARTCSATDVQTLL